MSVSSAAGVLIAALGMVLGLGACSADGNDQAAPVRAPGSASVVQFVRALRRDVETASEPPGLDEAVREREIRYTRMWLERLLPQDVRDALARASYRCVSGVGPEKDDAVVVSGKVGDVRVDVIDSRVLVLVITPNGAPGEIGRTFEQFVDFGYHMQAGLASFRAEESGEAGPDRIGTIQVDRGPGGRWFLEPIIWTSDGGRHLFIVDKAVAPPPSKVAHLLESAPESVDGASVTDSRTYRRFADSNREALARERFARILERRPNERVPDQDHGRRSVPK